MDYNIKYIVESFFDDEEQEEYEIYSKIPDYIDLGLKSKTLWASCNLGALRPYEIGNLYKWGEIEPSNDNNASNYKWAKWVASDVLMSVNKYSNNIDKLKKLAPEDDPVTQELGPKFSLPTKKQFQELIDNTTRKFSEQNGIKGVELISDINNNSIFIPFTMPRYNRLNLWSSTVAPKQNYCNAFCLSSFGLANLYVDDTIRRNYNYPVRPVLNIK